MAQSVTISIESAIGEAKRLISKAAADARDNNGFSLYEAIMPYSGDDPVLSGYSGDALGSLKARFADIVESESSDAIVFNIPDYTGLVSDEGQREIERYISLYVASMWLAAKGQARSKDLADSAAASIERMAVILKSRKAPERTML
jgi:hypothetical protein